MPSNLIRACPRLVTQWGDTRRSRTLLCLDIRIAIFARTGLTDEKCNPLHFSTDKNVADYFFLNLSDALLSGNQDGAEYEAQCDGHSYGMAVPQFP